MSLDDEANEIKDHALQKQSMHLFKLTLLWWFFALVGEIIYSRYFTNDSLALLALCLIWLAFGCNVVRWNRVVRKIESYVPQSSEFIIPGWLIVTTGFVPAVFYLIMAIATI